MNIQRDEFFKKYRSRDGRKVVILNTNGPDKNHPVVVAYETQGGGWTYDSVTNEGREFNLGVDVTTENDLEELNEITVKQTFVWKGTEESLQGQLGGPLEFTHFPDGTTVSEFREVVE